MELGWLFLAFDAVVLGVLLAPVLLGATLIVLGILRRSRRRVLGGVCLSVASAAFALLLLITPARSLRGCVQAPYSPLPARWADSDLAGTWRARYGRSVDTLIIKPDGTFRQIYEDRYDEGYVFETPWNRWWMERYADGRVRVYIEGARFYEEGTTVAEQGGGYADWTFYDQVAHEFVAMPEMLILNVRVDSSGEPLLLHMWSTGDEGFALLGCERNIFRRVEAP